MTPAGDALLVVADRPPRRGLRLGNRRLCDLLDGLRRCAPTTRVTLATLSDDARADADAELDEMGVDHLGGPRDWAGDLAARAGAYRAVVIHGAYAGRVLWPHLRRTQAGAVVLMDLTAAGEDDDPWRPPDPFTVVLAADPDDPAARAGGVAALATPVQPHRAADVPWSGRAGLVLWAALGGAHGTARLEAVRDLMERTLPRLRTGTGQPVTVALEDAPRGLRQLAERQGIGCAPVDDLPGHLAAARAVLTAPGPAAHDAARVAAAEAGTPVTADPARAARWLTDAAAWDAAADAQLRWALERTDAHHLRQLTRLCALAGLQVTRPVAPRTVPGAGAWTTASARRWSPPPGRPHIGGDMPAFPDQLHTASLPASVDDAAAERDAEYHEWRARRLPGDAERAAACEDMADWGDAPLISILTPIYNTEPDVMAAMIASVRDQWYPRWELCLVDDGSPDASTRVTLARLAGDDPRIKVGLRAANGGIVAASNDALAMAAGEFTALLDHDDELDPGALYEIARVLRVHPELDLVYSDEEKLDGDGVLCSPAFKASFAPDLLTAGNYMCHLSVYRTALLRAIGGFRDGVDGAQDLDLVLRVVEHTDRIAHVAKPLYRWRMVETSVAANIDAKPYAFTAGRRAVADALARRRRPGRAEDLEHLGTYRVRYDLRSALRVAVLVHGGVDGDARRAAADALSAREPGAGLSQDVRVVDEDGAGGPVRAMNEALLACDADLVAVVDAGIRFSSPDWLRELAHHAQRPEVGAAGAQLYLPGSSGTLMVTSAVARREWPEDRILLAIADNHRHVLHNAAAFDASCVMLRPALVREAGALDEALEHPALAWVDLTMRIRTRGYDLVCTPYPEATDHAVPLRGRVGSAGARRRLVDRWGLDRGWRDPYFNPAAPALAGVLGEVAAGDGCAVVAPILRS